MKKEIEIPMDRELQQQIVRLARAAGCSEEALIVTALQYALPHLEEEKNSLRSD